MTKQRLWNNYTELFRHYPEVAISFDFSRLDSSTERQGSLPGGFLQFLRGQKDRAASALAEMASLEGGAIANRDEERMVGHYWLRTPALCPFEGVRGQIVEQTAKLRDFSDKILKGAITSPSGRKFSQVLLVGIGGSALGPQLLYDAFGMGDGGLKLHFLDNTDPDGMGRVLHRLGDDLAETLVVVVSKSGGTIETRNGMLEVRHALAERNLDFPKKFVAVTCEGSLLDLQAADEGWLERFYIWDWVGGRTSIFSAVGLLPLLLQGGSIDGFLEGASKMDVITRNEYLQNPALLLALSWYYAGDGVGKKDMVVIPYCDGLQLFSKYLQQLVMESLGKAEDRDGLPVSQGIAVYGNKGSTDQHAYVQQLRDGLHNFFVTFIEVLSEGKYASRVEVESSITSGDYLQGFMLGTREALSSKGRQSICITIDSFSYQSVGALIALYERAVGFYASLVNINAYNQPGVEAGKKAAARIIQLKRRVIAELAKHTSKATAVDAVALAGSLGEPDDVEVVFKILEYLSVNRERSGVCRVGERRPQAAYYLRR